MFSSYFFLCPYTISFRKCPLFFGKTSAAFGEKVRCFWGKGPHCLGTTSEPVTRKVWKFTCSTQTYRLLRQLARLIDKVGSMNPNSG